MIEIAMIICPWISDWSRAPAVDRMGNVFIAADSDIVTYHPDGYTTQTNIAVVKYSANGALIWTNRYRGPGEDFNFTDALAVNNRGEIFAAFT